MFVKTSSLLVIVSLVIITCFNLNSGSGICTKEKLNKRNITVLLKATSYRDRNPYTRRLVTKWRKETKQIEETYIENYQDCCEGYAQIPVNGTLDPPINCAPICTHDCLNGTCIRPEECECRSGYSQDPANKYKCLPICTSPCGHGMCSAPDYCTCDVGYRFNNKTCEPICSTPCTNGSCIEPDICECWVGYKPVNNHTCSPECFKCLHGTCISPGNCICDKGWQNIKSLSEALSSNSQICQPICRQSCVNSTCMAPDNCECLSGYIRIDNTTCTPENIDKNDNGSYTENTTDLRSSVTENTTLGEEEEGTDVTPETCVCDIGWQVEKVNDTKNCSCQPVCDKTCVNATCVAPDECKCWPGLIKFDQYICTPDCSIKCSNSSCSSFEPEHCDCDTCLAKNATISISNKKHLEKWISSNWVFVLPPVLVVVTLLSFCVIRLINRKRSRQPGDVNDSTSVPQQNIKMNFLRRATLSVR